MKKKIIRIVKLMQGFGGYEVVVMDTDGEIETAFPADLKRGPMACDTVTMPANFFHYIAALQSQGVDVRFER